MVSAVGSNRVRIPIAISLIEPRDGIDSGCQWHAATWSFHRLPQAECRESLGPPKTDSARAARAAPAGTGDSDPQPQVQPFALAARRVHGDKETCEERRPVQLAGRCICMHSPPRRAAGVAPPPTLGRFINRDEDGE